MKKAFITWVAPPTRRAQSSNMPLRDRLHALLRDPAYSPANEFELARRLDLTKKDRASLAHEVRALLKSGHFLRDQKGRVSPSGGAAKRHTEPRKIFAATHRGPTLPSPEKTEIGRASCRERVCQYV